MKSGQDFDVTFRRFSSKSQKSNWFYCTYLEKAEPALYFQCAQMQFFQGAEVIGMPSVAMETIFGLLVKYQTITVGLFIHVQLFQVTPNILAGWGRLWTKKIELRQNNSFYVLGIRANIVSWQLKKSTLTGIQQMKVCWCKMDQDNNFYRRPHISKSYKNIATYYVTQYLEWINDLDKMTNFTQLSEYFPLPPNNHQHKSG